MLRVDYWSDAEQTSNQDHSAIPARKAPPASGPILEYAAVAYDWPCPIFITRWRQPKPEDENEPMGLMRGKPIATDITVQRPNDTPDLWRRVRAYSASMFIRQEKLWGASKVRRAARIRPRTETCSSSPAHITTARWSRSFHCRLVIAEGFFFRSFYSSITSLSAGKPGPSASGPLSAPQA